LIKDPYGRILTGIRIAVTNKCNLKCFYCHREGEENSHLTEMEPWEIATIVRIASKFGIKKVKITGGEPLIRNDITDLVYEVASVSGISEVSMTTNGVFLKKFAYRLAEVGLRRVNVSLDTLDRKRYEFITRRNKLNDVISGIHKAIDAGLNPVKINMVLLKGLNEDEVWNMASFASEVGAILQLIELVKSPTTPNWIFKRFHLNPEIIEREIKKKAVKVLVRKTHHRRKYILEDGCEIEIVKPMHNTEFCANCTRIRVTSDGKLKPCLLRNDNLVDILTPMRHGASMSELEELFLKTIKLREPYFKK